MYWIMARIWREDCPSSVHQCPLIEVSRIIAPGSRDGRWGIQIGMNRDLGQENRARNHYLRNVKPQVH